VVDPNLNSGNFQDFVNVAIGASNAPIATFTLRPLQQVKPEGQLMINLG
jgi:hypothetical protein